MIEEIDFCGRRAWRLRSPAGATAIVSAYGGQLLSWIPAGGEEGLYLSPLASHRPGDAIRGGVPVCFPQFAGFGPLPKHGLARTAEWQFSEASTPATLKLWLAADALTLQTWPCRFVAELTFRLDDRQVTTELAVINVDARPFDFSAALHTYLRLTDIAAASLRGLQGCRFRDCTDGDREQRQAEEALRVFAETDRIYRDVGATLQLLDGGRRLEIEQRGFTDVVVWNPWVSKAASLPDLPDGDYRRMLCVEAAAVFRPITLAPQGRWSGQQTLRVA